MQAMFLKIDVDECSDISESYGVTAMPTFIFLRNKVKIAQLTGGDKKELENKLAELCGGSSSSSAEESSGVPGHVSHSVRTFHHVMFKIKSEKLWVLGN